MCAGDEAQLHFPSNGLVITQIDIQQINPVDKTMGDLLMRSVQVRATPQPHHSRCTQMAIEISTKSVEAAAQHEAKREEQAARARIELQQLLNQVRSRPCSRMSFKPLQASAEEARITLLELRAVCAAVESTGQSTAEAEARAQALHIEGQAAIVTAELHARAAGIDHAAQLQQLVEVRQPRSAVRSLIMDFCRRGMRSLRTRGS